jgi:hypothetical protein
MGANEPSYLATRALTLPALAVETPFTTSWLYSLNFRPASLFVRSEDPQSIHIRHIPPNLCSKIGPQNATSTTSITTYGDLR